MLKTAELHDACIGEGLEQMLFTHPILRPCPILSHPTPQLQQYWIKQIG